MLASKHLVPVCLYPGLPSQRQESIDDGLRDEVLRVIEEESNIWSRSRCIFLGELGETGRILGEEVLKDQIGVLAVVDLLKLLPGRIFCKYEIMNSRFKTP